MASLPQAAVRGLDTLLRYELAAIRSYQLTERAIQEAPVRAELAVIRRRHESAADLLREHLALMGKPPADHPGLWEVLPTLAEASAAQVGPRSQLAVLRWSEEHAMRTYQAAALLPGLPPTLRALIGTALLPPLYGHVVRLEQLIAAQSSSSAGCRRGHARCGV